VFDIGFSELLLVLVIGLIVLGPERLPVAVKTVVGWIRALRSMAASVQTELSHELKLAELKESLQKVEQASLHSISPELKASVDELKEVAASFNDSYQHATTAAESTLAAANINTGNINQVQMQRITEPEAWHDEMMLHTDAQTNFSASTEPTAEPVILPPGAIIIMPPRTAIVLPARQGATPGHASRCASAPASAPVTEATTASLPPSAPEAH